LTHELCPHSSESVIKVQIQTAFHSPKQKTVLRDDRMKVIVRIHVQEVESYTGRKAVAWESYNHAASSYLIYKRFQT